MDGRQPLRSHASLPSALQWISSAALHLHNVNLTQAGITHSMFTLLALAMLGASYFGETLQPEVPLVS